MLISISICSPNKYRNKNSRRRDAIMNPKTETPINYQINLDTLLKFWAEKWAELHDSRAPYLGKSFSYTGDLTGSNIDSKIHKLAITSESLIVSEEEKQVGPAKLFPYSSICEQNPENKEKEKTISWSHTSTSSQSSAISKELTFDASLGFQFSIPTSTKIGASVDGQVGIAVNKSHTQSNTLQHDNVWTYPVEYVVNYKPQSLTTVDLTVSEQKIEKQISQIIHLSGYVIVRCAGSVRKTLNNSAETPHHCWPILITEVFDDLTNYVNALLNDTEKNDLNKKLAEFVIDKNNNRVSFTMEGKIFKVKITPQFQPTSTPLRAITHQPEEIRQTLITQEAEKRSIYRLFYPEVPIPVEKYFIQLSIISQDDNKQRVQRLSNLNIDESSDAYDNLYGQIEQIITVDQILTALPSPEKILITGTAGIGKTTLSHYLPYLWAQGQKGQGQWGKEYDWLCLVALRQLQKDRYPEKETPYTAMDILLQECIFPAWVKQHANESLDFNEKALLKSTLQSAMNNKKILLILDGYDEISELLPSYLVDAVKELMQYEKIIVTSRPYGLQGLESEEAFGFKPTWRLEVTGFSPENIQQYINKFFTTAPLNNDRNQIAQLQQFLERNPAIHGSCRIPINLELVCTAWETQELEQAFLSMSQLYERVIFSLGMRHMIKNRQLSMRESINVTPNAVFTNCQVPLGLLGYFAYCSLANKKLFLTLSSQRKDLNILSYVQQKNDYEDNELIQQQKEFGLIKPEGRHDGSSRYYFNHLTFRDYFAACYLAQCLQTEVWGETTPRNPVSSYPHSWYSPNGTSVKAYLSSQKHMNYMTMTLWLIAGKLSQVGDIKSLEAFFEMLLDSSPRDELGYANVLLLIRCVDEVQDNCDNLNAHIKNNIFNIIRVWLDASIRGNQLFFEDAINIDMLWAQLTLSPCLCQQPIVQNCLSQCIKTSDPTILLRVLSFLSTVNYSLSSSASKQLCIELLSALGNADINLNFILITLKHWEKQQPLLSELLMNQILNENTDIGSQNIAIRSIQLTLFSELRESKKIFDIFIKILDSKNSVTLQQSVLHVFHSIIERSILSKSPNSALKEFLLAHQAFLEPIQKAAASSIESLQKEALMTLENIFFTFVHQRRDTISDVTTLLSDSQPLLKPIQQATSSLSEEIQAFAIITLANIIKIIEPPHTILKSLTNSIHVAIKSQSPFLQKTALQALCNIFCHGFNEFMERKLTKYKFLLDPIQSATASPIESVRQCALLALSDMLSSLFYCVFETNKEQRIKNKLLAFQPYLKPLYYATESSSVAVQETAFLALGNIIGAIFCHTNQEDIVALFSVCEPLLQPFFQATSSSESKQQAALIATGNALGIAMSSLKIWGNSSVIHGSTRQLNLFSNLKIAVNFIQRSLNSSSIPLQKAASTALIYYVLKTSEFRRSFFIKENLISSTEERIYNRFHDTLIRNISNLPELSQDFLDVSKFAALILLPLIFDPSQILPIEISQRLLYTALTLSDDQLAVCYNNLYSLTKNNIDTNYHFEINSEIRKKAYINYLIKNLLYKKISCDVSKELPNWPLSEACYIKLLTLLLEATPTDSLWTYYTQINTDDAMRRQNILAVLLQRFILQGKAVYIENNQLYYYKNKQYEGLSFETMPLSQVRQDLKKAALLLGLPVSAKNDAFNNTVENEQQLKEQEISQLREENAKLAQELQQIKEQQNKPISPALSEKEDIDSSENTTTQTNWAMFFVPVAFAATAAVLSMVNKK